MTEPFAIMKNAKLLVIWELVASKSVGQALIITHDKTDGPLWLDAVVRVDYFAVTVIWLKCNVKGTSSLPHCDSVQYLICPSPVSDWWLCLVLFLHCIPLCAVTFQSQTLSFHIIKHLSHIIYSNGSPSLLRVVRSGAVVLLCCKFENVKFYFSARGLRIKMLHFFFLSWSSAWL